MANTYTGSDTGKAGLEVKKTTGTPDVKGVTEIQLDTNLTLTDNGNGGVTIQSSGGGGGSGVTSVGLTETGSALTITNSPITTSGDINIAGAGSSSQVILGDLSLGTFTEGTVTSVGLTGGGSSLIITNTPITTSGNINIAGAGLPSQVILGNLGLGTHSTPANPTATIGATATNGTSTNTFMRSDAAPALEITGVTANTYGSSTTVGQFTVDATGRINSAASVAISGGGGGASPIFSKHFNDWGATLQLLQDRTPGSASYNGVDVVNLNDYQYFTPLVNDQFADVTGGFKPEVLYQFGGDNNAFGASKNTTPFSLTPGQTFRLTTGMDTAGSGLQVNFSLEEYNTNVFGGGFGPNLASFIVNPAFLGLDGAGVGNLFTKITLGSLDLSAPIEDVMYNTSSMGVLEIMYLGTYDFKGDAIDIFMVSNQGLLDLVKGTPLLQAYV